LTAANSIGSVTTHSREKQSRQVLNHHKPELRSPQNNLQKYKNNKNQCQQAAYLIFPSISFSLRFGECSELPGDASEGSKLLLWRFCGFTKKLQKSAIALLHGPISFQTGLHDKRMITFHPYGSVLAKEPSRAQWVLFIGTTELFLRAKMCFL
jgi:hypothetical protein